MPGPRRPTSTELGAGGVEDAPSGYLDDASPDGVGTAASDAEQDAALEALTDAGVATGTGGARPADQMREELRGLPGDWYVVHSYAGYENKVKTNLESRIQSLNMEDYIFQIEVPTEEVIEIKGGKRQPSCARSSPATCSCAWTSPTSRGRRCATPPASPASSARPRGPPR